MNILHVGSLYNDPYSGVCVVVPHHVEMQGRTNNVALLNITNVKIDGAFKQLYFEKNFSLDTLPSPFNSPDLVVFHEIYHIEFAAIAKALRKRSIPYIIVPHGGLTSNALNKKRLKKLVGNFFVFDRYIRNAKALQCLSKFECDETKFKVPKFIATNGVSVPGVRKADFTLDRGVNFVYIGRLDIYHKGLDLLLQSVEKNKKLLLENKCKIDLYGPPDGKNENIISNYIENLGIEELVLLHDAVNGKEKESILLDADIFIQTSRFEGMPMGILEAMSYGVPVLVTDGTTLSDRVNAYGAGSTAGNNVDSIAGQMKNLILKRNLYGRMSEGALRLIEENFSWDVVIEAALDNYRRMVANETDK